MKGYDAAFDLPDPECMWKNGYRFAVRYLWDNPSTPATKLLTKAEADKLLSLGFGVVSNYESWANRAMDGYHAGVADAKTYQSFAAKAGAPGDEVVYVSVDFDATMTNLTGPVSEYFRGWQTVIPLKRLGVYGSYRTVGYLYNKGLVRWLWQTYAWSYGQWDLRTHIRQTRNHVSGCGGTYDINETNREDYGQWKVDMALTDDDIKRIWAMASVNDVLPVPRVDVNGDPVTVDPDDRHTPATYLLWILEEIRKLNGRVMDVEEKLNDSADPVVYETVRKAIRDQLDDNPET